MLERELEYVSENTHEKLFVTCLTFSQIYVYFVHQLRNMLPVASELLDDSGNFIQLLVLVFEKLCLERSFLRMQNSSNVPNYLEVTKINPWICLIGCLLGDSAPSLFASLIDWSLLNVEFECYLCRG